MRSAEPVRVEVQHLEGHPCLGYVVSTEHPDIQVNATAFVTPSRKPDVLAPMLFTSGGRVYRADYAPLRLDRNETRRMYFIRSKMG